MAHGYLREYDEEPRGSDDRDQRDWRDRDDRGWRSREGGGFMFDDDRDRSRNRGSNRGAWDNNRDRQRNRGSSDYGREHGFAESNEWSEGRQSFSSHPDDHYRSWRDKQMQSLDRDYAEYCREREQEFHRDFDSWRSQRHANPQPLRTGMTQTGLSADPTGELQLSTEDQSPSQPGQDPMAAATLGSTSGGRKR